MLQKSAHYQNEVRTGMESPLLTPTRPMLSGEMSLVGQKWTPEKKFFSDSDVDFNGEATGTFLEAQIRLEPEIWPFEVDVGTMSVQVRKGLRMGIPGRSFSDKYEPEAGVWY